MSKNKVNSIVKTAKSNSIVSQIDSDGNIEIMPGVKIRADISSSDIIGVQVAQIETRLETEANESRKKVKANEQKIAALRTSYKSELDGFNSLAEKDGDKVKKKLLEAGFTMNMSVGCNAESTKNKTVNFSVSFTEENKTNSYNHHSSRLVRDFSYPFTKKMNEINSEIESLNKIQAVLNEEYTGILRKRSKLPAMERQLKAQFTNNILRSMGTNGNILMDAMEGKNAGVETILNSEA